MIVSPNKNLQDAIRANTDITLIEGVYRLRDFALQRVGLSKPITIRGAGARKTIILGSIDVRSDSAWGKPVNGIYTYIGRLTNIAKSTIGGEVSYERADYAIDLIADNTPLRHVANLTTQLPPSFHYDPSDGSLRINFIPSDFESLELSVCDRAFKADHIQGITIADLTIQDFANPAQQGAVDLDYCNAHIEGVEVRLNHGVGIKVGSNSVVRESWLNDNGQQGINIGGESVDNPVVDVLIDDCRIERNNYARFKRDVEAGNKFTFTRGLTVRNCLVKDNYGHALWLDAGNEDYEVLSNLILNNNSSGVYIEISKGGVIRGNFLSGNAINRRAETQDKQASKGQVWVDTSNGDAQTPIEVTENTFTGDCLHLALRNDNRPDYSLQFVDVEANRFFGGAMSVNDIHTNNPDGRNIKFDANVYTPDVVAWWQNTLVAKLDGSVLNLPTPATPIYTALPDLDAVIAPEPKPIPVGKSYRIQASIKIAGIEIGTIDGTIEAGE